MQRDEGAALVEFALVLPLLVMLTFGIIEFGRAYNAQITLTHASREGVRVLAITGDAGQAALAARNAAPNLDPGLISISTGACNEGEPTSVEASYPHAISIPFFGDRTMTLRSSAVMRCGG
ncbi:MAG: pilus assembly protein [Acidimicrobiia bacterium]|nr:MAG: pilus assembly protein [Acidimicrobiia bacterium]